MWPLVVVSGALTMGAVGVAAGCSSSTGAVKPNADGGPCTDTGCSSSIGVASADASDAGPCTGTLEYVRRAWGLSCPNSATCSVDGSDAYGHLPLVLTGTCGGLNVIRLNFGIYSQYCFYMDGDGGALVGASAQDDTRTFCEHTSFTVRAGSTPFDVDTTSPLLSACFPLIECPHGDAASD